MKGLKTHTYYVMFTDMACPASQLNIKSHFTRVDFLTTSVSSPKTETGQELDIICAQTTKRLGSSFTNVQENHYFDSTKSTSSRT